jgi:hypothetical protein
MKRQYLIITLALSLLSIHAYAQEPEPFKHHQIVATIGHALIPSSEEKSSTTQFIAVPTWGLSYEYDFNDRIGLGVKSDIELSNYRIEDNEEQKLIREYPISVLGMFKVNPVEGLGVYVAGGVEFDSNKNLSVINFGFTYDVDFLEGWVLSPEIGYELKGGHTSIFTVGLSVAFRFGK